MFNSLLRKKTSFSAGIKNLLLDRHTDPRLLIYSPPKFIHPRKLDFRELCIPTDDQKKESNCSAFSVAAFCEVDHWRNQFYPKQFDADEIFNKAIKMFHYTKRDDGISIREAAESLFSLGVTDFIEYKFISPINATGLKFAIHKYCVCVCTFRIYDFWNQVTKNGRVQMTPYPRYLGGHSVIACGYDDEGLYIQNSWGSNWAVHGFALIPWSIVDSDLYNIMILQK